jgi:hypothetical protein
VGGVDVHRAQVDPANPGADPTVTRDGNDVTRDGNDRSSSQDPDDARPGLLSRADQVT